MEQNEIKTGNEAIAVALGFTKSVMPEYWDTEPLNGISLLHFHDNWEWLMFALNELGKRGHKIVLQYPYEKEKVFQVIVRFVQSNTFKG